MKCVTTQVFPLILPMTNRMNLNEKRAKQKKVLPPSSALLISPRLDTEQILFSMNLIISVKLLSFSSEMNHLHFWDNDITINKLHQQFQMQKELTKQEQLEILNYSNYILVQHLSQK